MKWKKLEHNGILFPPDFETKNIKIKIKGESMNLDILQEEMIYQWAKKKDTPYVQDKIFQKNFLKDFAKTFGKKYNKLELRLYILVFNLPAIVPVSINGFDFCKSTCF